ncbi:hypothetical protein AAZX31_04G093100, partial [Glycine max]
DPSNRKPCRPRSWCWDHFEKIKDIGIAKCNWCTKDYVVDSDKNDTSNLINHFLNKCKNFPKESLGSSQQTLAFQQMKKDGKGSGSVLNVVHFDVDACRQSLARIIIMDEFSFKFVEGGDFTFY